MARTLERRREHDAGIATLFAAAAEEQGEGAGTWEGTELAIPDQEFSKHERLRFEKEMLGLYVSDHPLLGAAGMLAPPHRPHDRRGQGARRAAPGRRRRRARWAGS